MATSGFKSANGGQSGGKQKHAQIDRSKLARSEPRAEIDSTQPKNLSNPALSKNVDKTLGNIDSVLDEATQPDLPSASTQPAQESSALDRNSPAREPASESSSMNQAASSPQVTPVKTAQAPGLQASPELASKTAAATSSKPSSLRKFGAGMKRGISSNPRKALASGGIIGLIVIGLIGGFTALLPLKIESMVKNILADQLSRPEHYVDKRVTKIAYRYLYAATARGGSSAGVYASNSVMGTLFGNLRKNQFERKLFEKYGMKLEPGATNGSIRITIPDAASVEKLNETEFIKFLDGSDLTGNRARDFIKLTTRDVLRPHQILRRAHLRRFMRNAYRVHRWGLPERKDSTKPVDPTTSPATIDLELQEGTLGASEEVAVESVTCLVGGDSCPDGPERRQMADGTPRDRPQLGVSSDPANGDRLAAGEETKKGIRSGYAKAKQTASKAIAGAVEKTLAEVIGKEAAKVATASMGKAVPIVGWIWLGVDIDHLFWENGISKIKSAKASVEYANLFATWASSADQLKAGKLTTSQVNDLLQKTDNIHQSAAFQQLYMGRNAGIKMADDKKVGSSGGNAPPQSGEHCDAFYYEQHFNDPTPTSIADIITFDYRKIASNPVSFPPFGWHAPACFIRPVFDTLGGIVGPALQFAFKAGLVTIDAAVRVFNFLPGPDLPIPSQAAEAVMRASFSWMFDKFFPPVATGREVGPDLFTGVHGGADVIANGFARDSLGGRKLSDSEADAQKQQFVLENNKDLAASGFIARTFSTDSPTTLASRFFAFMPATSTSFVHSTLAVLASPLKLLSSPFLPLIGESSAAAVFDPNPYSIQRYGYTSDELEQDLKFAPADIAGPPDGSGKLTGPDGIIDRYDCPNNSDANVSNICLMDNTAAESMNSALTGNDDGGLTSGAAAVPDPALPPAGVPAASLQLLAQQILANTNITYWTVNGVNTRDVFVALAAGQPAYTTCANANGATPDVNPKILQFILEAASQTKVMVNALTDKCHANGSTHYSGQAVDLGVAGSGPLSILNPIATKYGGVKNSETNQYHYDFLK